MAERNTKGGADVGADTKDDTKAKGDAGTKANIKATGDADIEGDIDRLRQGLDDLRGSVASLTARFGEGALATGGRGLRQARQVTGEVAEDVADWADEGVATLRGRIEDQPLATMALAFFAGMAFAGLVMGGLIAGGPAAGRPRRRPGGAAGARGGRRRRDHQQPG